MTGPAPADTAVAAARSVNGPEDERLDWDAIDWRTVEDDVRRLRQRIFKASQAGDLAQVRNLQKLTHTRCQPRHRAQQAAQRRLCTAREPPGLA